VLIQHNTTQHNTAMERQEVALILEQEFMSFEDFKHAMLLLVNPPSIAHLRKCRIFAMMPYNIFERLIQPYGHMHIFQDLGLDMTPPIVAF